MADAADSFKSRVDKIFGSLSSSSSQSFRPSWSLTGDEVEKREWNRDKGDPNIDDRTPCFSSLDGFFNKKDCKTSRRNRRDLQDLSDDDDDEEDGDDDNGNGDDTDEWEVRSSIGLDCTLDNEDEEDAYDKMAEGKENIGDRLYLKDVTDHGPYLNSHNVLPSSVHDAPRDARANHHAAKIRLEEDEALAENLGSNQTFDEPMLKGEEPCVIASEYGGRVKSILKRKNDEAVKSLKRVRFDTTCKDNYEAASEQNQDNLAGDSSTGTNAGGDDSIFSENERRVPDYILNPSKYTCYSFDSSHDVNEESNSEVYMNFLKLVKKSEHNVLEQQLEHSSTDIPKSVVFTPRKRASDGKPATSSSKGKVKQSFTEAAGSALSIAAGEVQHVEVCVMQEDEPHMDAGACTNASFQKPGRRYRSKLGVEDDVS